MGLTNPIGLTLRTCTGDKIVKLDYSEGKDWEMNVIEKGLSCSLSSWRIFEDQLDNVQICGRMCFASTPRNYSFICTLSFDIH